MQPRALDDDAPPAVGYGVCMLTLLLTLAACTVDETGRSRSEPANSSTTEPSSSETLPTDTPSSGTTSSTSGTSTTSTSTTDTPTTGTSTTGPTTGGTTSTEPVVDEEDAGSPGDESEALFDDTVVHEVAITLPDDSVVALTNDGYTYVPGSVTVDGVHLDLVGVRLRGKIGSFRELDEKPKFKIDFNQYIGGQRLFGVETLTLNNSVVDCSFLIEKVAYEAFREVGVPASRITFATVTLNGEPYGLYQLVETQDDRYLEHHFEDPSGNLYDGKYVYDGSFDTVTLDFEADLWPLFQLEEGVDVGNEDVARVSEVIATSRRTPDFYAETGAVVDMERLHRFLAVEQWVDNWDGYALNQNNYRVYFDPSVEGRAVVLPFDLDLALDETFWDIFFDWSRPTGELAEACYDDPVCTDAHREAVAEVLDTLDAMDLEARMEQWGDLTLEAALADPRKECGDDDVGRARRDLAELVSERSADLGDFWGL